jgi:excisionase family DNA binding protein
MGERLTITETARRIGIARTTLHDWIRERGLPVHHLTAYQRRCDWDEVTAWIAQQAALAAPPEPGRLLRLQTYRGGRRKVYRSTR